MSYKKKSKKGYQRRQKLMTNVAAKVEKAKKKTGPRKRPPSAIAPAVTAKAAAPAKVLPSGKKITIHYKHGKTKVSGL